MDEPCPACVALACDWVRDPAKLLRALHDAINRPKGVVPESAEPFYDPVRYKC